MGLLTEDEIKGIQDTINATRLGFDYQKAKRLIDKTTPMDLITARADEVTRGALFVAENSPDNDSPKARETHIIASSINRLVDSKIKGFDYRRSEDYKRTSTYNAMIRRQQEASSTQEVKL